MTPLDLVRLKTLMMRTSGIDSISIGLIDGPVLISHPGLDSSNFRTVNAAGNGSCTRTNSTACLHGTFIAGILAAKRISPAPAICPGCTVLIRSVFRETEGNAAVPAATPEELATAIIDCVVSGARCINLSLAVTRPSTKGEHELEQALDYCARREVLVVAAAGNQGTLGSSAITRHPWVIPVVACDIQGRPLNESNLGGSIGRRGLRAPGDRITSLGTDGGTLTFGGTSVAVPFVTGAIALLWSEFPNATATQIKLAITQSTSTRRASIVPPLLDAETAFQILSTTKARRQPA